MTGLCTTRIVTAGDFPPADLELVEVAAGLASPVVITHAGDGSDRLFIVEKAGRIRIVEDGALLPAPFLDIDPVVNSSGFEQGLLGLAFDPDYATNGDFFVYYTRADNATVVAHYNADPPSGNTAGTTGTVLWTQAQPQSNHNGGQLAFGPDGLLYIAVGDGGIQGDPNDNSQNLNTHLGKILRIAVNGPDPYTIPFNNPFVGDPSALDEIWQSGLRNPWRFSFDRASGDLFIGDVGFGSKEEINLAPASSVGGENWGWRCYEGDQPHNTTGCGPIGTYDFPILVYTHTLGRCSVTGGYRYRGSRAPGLQGTYLFGDWCSGDVWAGIYDATNDSWSAVELSFPQDLGGLTTFGEDEGGNVHLAAGTRVFVFNQVGAIFADDFESNNLDAWDNVVP
jgi:glucose/arabinose dehydrogenase